MWEGTQESIISLLCSVQKVALVCVVFLLHFAWVCVAICKVEGTTFTKLLHIFRSVWCAVYIHFAAWSNFQSSKLSHTWIVFSASSSVQCSGYLIMSCRAHNDTHASNWG